MKQNIYDNALFFKGYEEIRNRKFNYNNLLERPNFLALMPDVKGKMILDLGCGKGEFANDCVLNGAQHVDAIDISGNMITAAKELYKSDCLYFEQISMEDIQLEKSKYHLITSALALHYVSDFEGVIEKVSHALSPEGVFLFSVEHPISTANKGEEQWILDEEGSISHFAVAHYQEEGKRTQNWLVNHVVMYHRTMETILNTLITNGLQIEKIVEPMPTEEAIELLPNLQKEKHRPSFLIVKARKTI
ncbi:class I SAM-dependent methyltransferase [Solibacillus sp. FSL R5-0691]|uniref:class I SAM-dependent DNA methyltransferase n=1 Tax=Solibacillus sp. FSL R5-0691 TaxID=2921653 RepID=UPI0030D45AD5